MPTDPIVIPDRYKDRVLSTDRKATVEEALQVTERDCCDKPIAIWLDAQDLGVLVAKRATPFEFKQELLRRFKAAGVRMEGLATLRLSSGAVAKLKSDPNNQEMGFRYIWLPPEAVVAIAKA